MNKINYTDIKNASDKLNSIATTLKNEFFGLDEIIDKIITYIKPWYIYPELLTRPVIINLWGMTGVGKTALVRRLVELLGFSDRFIEVPMNDVNYSFQRLHGEYHIAYALERSNIQEGTPGILLLDEFQHFRTIDSNGKDIVNDKYADVWSLLSDGKFSANPSFLYILENAFITYKKEGKDYGTFHSHRKKIIKLLNID